MTPEQLAEIEKRLAAATPGPIDVHRYDNDGGDISFQLQARTGTVICSTNDYDNPRAKADAHLYAHAPADITALLAEVRRLRAEYESCDEERK